MTTFIKESPLYIYQERSCENCSIDGCPIKNWTDGKLHLNGGRLGCFKYCGPHMDEQPINKQGRKSNAFIGKKSKN